MVFLISNGATTKRGLCDLKFSLLRKIIKRKQNFDSKRTTFIDIKSGKEANIFLTRISTCHVVPSYS